MSSHVFSCLLMSSHVFSCLLMSPSIHLKDKEDYVQKRIATLYSYDVGSAAVALCSAAVDSPQCKELLSRIFLALVQDDKMRGRLVQQGGGKVSPICLVIWPASGFPIL